MRFQQVVLESEGAAVSAELHPRLTVVAGLTPLERAALIGEFLGGLTAPREGMRLEVVEDGGRRIAIIGRENGADEVVDATTGADLTEQFVDASGRVNLLHAFGIDAARVKRLCRLTASDIRSIACEDGVVLRLAAHDQGGLWNAAERVRAADVALHEAVAEVGADPADALLVEEIELRHAAFDAACAQLETVRHHGIFIGTASVLGAVPAMALSSPVVFYFLGVATLTTLVSIVYRRRVERARADERRALNEAGVESYLDFRLQRVQRVLEAHGDTAVLARAAEQRQSAVDQWRDLAGDISVDRALDLRDRVLELAPHIRVEDTDELLSVAEPQPADLAHALVSRLAALRNVGPQARTLPLLLDEPLAEAAPEVKTWMLDLIRRSAGRPQVIYLTEDPDVATWARHESISGDLSVIEPGVVAAHQ